MSRTRRLAVAVSIVAAGVLGTAGVAYAGDYPGDDSSHSRHHDGDHHSHHCACRDDGDGGRCDGDYRDRHDRDWYDREGRDRDCRDWYRGGLLGRLLGAF